MAFLQEYTMLEELGQGGFATVYRVRHNDLGYIRAVRVLKETIIDPKSKIYQDFMRECKVLLRLGNGNHPNIVHIYQPRLLNNRALVEMDCVDGQDIRHYLKKEQYFVSLEEVIRLATQIGNALAYCHEDIYRFCMDREQDRLPDDPDDGSKVLIDEPKRQELIKKYKVIHNDIHPGNIMRRENGNLVLLDFGLAINGDEVVHSSRHANGAPEFKAPEKWDNESTLTEQSDIYSFGIILYQYLAGRVPFQFDVNRSNKTEAEYLLSKAHQNETPPPIETFRKEFFEKKFEGQKYERDYPQWLEDLILKCLAKNPADRYANGRELYEAVQAGVSQMRVDDALRLKDECDRLKTALAQEEKEHNQLKTTLANQKSECDQLNIDLDKQKSEQDLLKTTLARQEIERQRLKGDLETLQKRILELETKGDGETGGDGAGKWKVLSLVLLLALLTCGGLLWHFHSSGDNEFDTDMESVDMVMVVDSLQQVIDQLEKDTTDLSKQMAQLAENSGNGDTDALVEDLRSQISALQSEKATQEVTGKVDGKTAQQWKNDYNTLLRNSKVDGKTAQQWKDDYNTLQKNSKVDGKTAQQWKNDYNKLQKDSKYKDNDAKYWYEKYMGYR